MKSELEKSNSWGPFLDQIHHIIQQKDFRPSTIRSLFQYVDPEFSLSALSFSQWLSYLIFWHTSERGRAIRYLSSLARFTEQKKEVFRECPKQVIEAYNGLLVKMVGTTAAQPLCIPESWARVEKSRYHRILERGEQIEKTLIKDFNAIRRQALGLEKAPPPPEPLPQKEEAPSEEAPSLQFKAEPIKEEPPPPPVVKRPQYTTFPYTLFHDLSKEDHEAMEKRRELFESLLFRSNTLKQDFQSLKREYPDEDFMDLEELLSSYTLEGPFFPKDTLSEEVLKNIETLDQKISKAEKKLKELWTSLSFRSLEVAKTLSLHCMREAFFLYPYLSAELSWNDLSEKLPSLNASFAPLFHELFHQNLSEKRMESLFFQISQLDDLRALSGEISYRSHRQNDLIQAAMVSVQKACLLQSLFLSIGLPQKAEELSSHISSILTIVHQFLSPRFFFSSLSTREDISTLFRTTWVTLEPLIERIDTLFKEVDHTWSEERQHLFTREMSLFLTDVDRSNLYSQKLYPTYQAFLKNHTIPHSWTSLLQWNERFGLGILFLSQPRDIRLESLTEWKVIHQKRDEIHQLKQQLLTSFFGDPSYLESLSSALPIVMDLLFLSRVKDGPLITHVADQVNALFCVWHMCVPSSLYTGSDKTAPLSLETLKHVLSESTHPKVRLFLRMVLLHEKIESLRSHGESSSLAEASHLSQVERRLWETLFTNGFVISSQTFLDYLPSLPPASPPELSLPMVGDIGYLSSSVVLSSSSS